MDAVVSFLRGAGAYNIEVGPHRDAVLFSMNAGDAERAFATRLYAYTHAERGVTAIRAGAGYSVPASLARSIRLVSGLLRLPVLGGPRIVPDVDGSVDGEPVDAVDAVDAAWPADCGSKCKNKVTPGVIAARYSLPTSSSAVRNGNGSRNGNGNGNGNGTQSSIAVSEFQGQVWDQGDLTRFQTTCGLSFNVTVDHESGKISKGTVCKIPVLGTAACGEALLDIEYAKAVAGGDIPLTDIYASGYNLLKWAQTVEALADPPLIQSVSYGNDVRLSLRWVCGGFCGGFAVIDSGDCGVSKRFHLFTPLSPRQ